MAHQCLVTLPGGERCPAIIRDDDILMDAPHWRRVPRDLQRDVHVAWRRGAGRGTPELYRAQNAAIAAVEEILLAETARPQPNRRA